MTPPAARPPSEFSELVALNADEVVTRAYPNDVTLPDGRTLVLITLDNNDTSRPNTFGPRSLIELRAALVEVTRRAAAGEIAAVALTGTSYVFCAGADLSTTRVPSRRVAALLPRLGHDVFGMLSTAGVPSFVFINGLALGGGLEVALHADYRSVNLAAAGIGLPEVSLGLVPGWGGSWLLPNLIGIEAALRVIVENPLLRRTLRGPDVHRLGIADAGFGAARFLEDSIEWAGQVLTGAVRVERQHLPGRLERRVKWDLAVAVARRHLAERIGTVPEAPFEALALLQAARGGSREAGFAREEKALTRLICGAQFQASSYAFSLVQHRARHPAGAPDAAEARPVTKVGIVGAGLMACQIASVMLHRLAVPVVISDTDQGRVDAGLNRIRATLAKLHEKGRIDEDRLGRLTSALSGTVNPSGFEGCDWVTEAVFEDLSTKHEALRAVESAVGDDAVLATNTSSLSVAAIAAGLNHPERLIGFHFFNPVARMPLVEVIPADHTSQQAVATAFALAARLKKNPILIRDTTGFAVNRVLARFLAEVMAAIEAGIPPEKVDAALQPMGLPMAPSMLLELVGLPVAAHVLATHHAAFGDRYPRSENLARLADYGHLYLRDRSGRPTTIDKKARSLILGRGRPLPAAHVLEQMQDALADEIHRMLDERVVDSVEDIDLALILGAGWPFHTGGITPYLDRVGASQRAFGTTFHHPVLEAVR